MTAAIAGLSLPVATPLASADGTADRSRGHDRIVTVDDDDGAVGSLVVIGDSLTYAYLDHLAPAATANGFGPVRIDAEWARRISEPVSLFGSRISSGLDAVEAARAAGSDPDVWVVALGTNDVSLLDDPGERRRSIRELLEAIGPDETVVWIDVWAPAAAEASLTFNDALADVARRQPLMSVSSWSTLASVNPQWFVDDGVHNTLEGARQRNLFVIEAALRATRAWPVEMPSPEPVTTGPPALLVPDPTGSTAAKARLTPGQQWVAPVVVDADATGQVLDIRTDAAEPGVLNVGRCGRVPIPFSIGPGADTDVQTVVARRGQQTLCISASVDATVRVRSLASLVETMGVGIRPRSERRTLFDAAAGPTPQELTPIPGRSPVLGLSVTSTVLRRTTVYLHECTRPSRTGTRVRFSSQVSTRTVLVARTDVSLCVSATAPGTVTVDLVTAGSDSWTITPIRRLVVVDTRLGVGGWKGHAAAGQELPIPWTQRVIGWSSASVNACSGSPRTGSGTTLLAPRRFCVVTDERALVSVVVTALWGPRPVESAGEP